jgi:hypothetical protein
LGFTPAPKPKYRESLPPTPTLALQDGGRTSAPLPPSALGDAAQSGNTENCCPPVSGLDRSAEPVDTFPRRANRSAALPRYLRGIRFANEPGAKYRELLPPPLLDWRDQPSQLTFPRSESERGWSGNTENCCPPASGLGQVVTGTSRGGTPKWRPRTGEADTRVQAARTNLQRIRQGHDVACRDDPGIIAFSLIVLVASYAACCQSFELLCSEKKPLGLWAVRPPCLVTFAPEATRSSASKRCGTSSTKKP